MQTRFTLLLLFLTSFSFAQTEEGGLPVSIAYFGNYIIQPGLKIGTRHTMKQWQGQASKSQQLLFSPQVGVYTRPGNNTNYVLNLEFGYHRQKAERKRHAVYSIGLAYLLQSNLVSRNVSLGSGDQDYTRASEHAFVPTIAYEFGALIKPQWRWYVKTAVGNKFRADQEGAMIIWLDFGLITTIN